MTLRIHRSIDSPLRTGLNRDELWEADDKGLIKCWEIGRQRAARFPDLARQSSPANSRYWAGKVA
jgi:hypothetical protein